MESSPVLSSIIAAGYSALLSIDLRLFKAIDSRLSDVDLRDQDLSLEEVKWFMYHKLLRSFGWETVVCVLQVYADEMSDQAVIKNVISSMKCLNFAYLIAGYDDDGVGAVEYCIGTDCLSENLAALTELYKPLTTLHRTLNGERVIKLIVPVPVAALIKRVRLMNMLLESTAISKFSFEDSLSEILSSQERGRKDGE